MNLKMKTTLTVLTLLAAIFFMTACSSEENPYQVNDAENYNVSVKYDANGGTFTTNTSVIVDSYNISTMEKNSKGEVEIALLSPDNSLRGNDAFTAVKSGHFLAGWYAERTESTDREGNPVYSYSKQWDFTNDLLTVDANQTYTAEEPVVTLYAVWVPMFEIEFYSLDSGEYMSSYTFNPSQGNEIQVPAWDEETGKINMFDFPGKAGYTFKAVYKDENGSELIDGESFTHPGTVDYATGTAKNEVLKLYVEWQEGEWYHIYNVEQFLNNANVSGSYIIHADLDFEGEIWPTTLMYGNFSGTIEGNGHTFKNINIEQTNNSKVNAGLFGHLTETAAISGLTFENVTFTIKAGTRVVGTSYGLLAGSISSEAIFTDVVIKSSVLQIDSACYFGASDYSIGLLCGMGDASVIDYSGITCKAVGDNPESVVLSVEGNEVTVEFVTE